MDEATKIKILNSIDHVEFLNARYAILMKKCGNVFKSNCPFHEEKTSSFTLFPANQKNKWPTMKCFGCGKFVNLIDLVMEKEGLSFIEACKILGGYIGMEISTTPKNPIHEQYKETMTQHGRRYCRTLATDNAKLDYLRNERGLTDLTLSTFGIGATPTDEFRYRSDMGYINDRIAFPIFEHKLPGDAKVVAMGYRTLKDKDPNYDKDKDPKYINDKNTSGDLDGVFTKGQYLYGYPQAFQEIRRNNYAVVVEGYVDVLSMHQAGMINTVGVLSASLTKQQMEALKSLTKYLIFFLDSDEVGMNSMMKTIPTLLQEGFIVKVIMADGGKDPADLCVKKKFDNAQVKGYIMTNAVSALDYMIDFHTKQYQNYVSKERSRILNTIMPIIDMCQGYEREVARDTLLKKIDMK